MTFSGPFAPMALSPAIYVLRNPQRPNILVGQVGFTVACNVTGHTRDSLDSNLRFKIGFPPAVRSGLLQSVWMHVTSEGFAPDAVEFDLSPLGVNPGVDARIRLTVPVKMIQCQVSTSPTSVRPRRRSSRPAVSG